MNDSTGNPPVSPARLTSRAAWIWSALIIVATVAVYLWVGQSSFDRFPRVRAPGFHETDHFNLLSRGFIKGHLYLDLEVPPEIVRAANPYDPALRERISVLHDASYYRGHYYIYFGPAPVVTLLLPFTLATGRELPLPMATWIFSIAGYLALIAIFFFVQRRHFPGASTSAIAAALLSLGAGNMLLPVLRRSHIWELPIAAGFCFFTICLLCLVRSLYSRRATVWAAAGGLALGLAVASRPTYLLSSVLFVLPLIWQKKKAEAGNFYRWPALLAAGAGCAAIGLALGVYNYQRFGNPFDFGVNYQLSGTGEMQNRHFSLTYVAFNFRVYFLSALKWVATFPFLTGPFVLPYPPGHAGHEFSYGLFRNLPFSCFSFAAFAVALGWRRNRLIGESPRLAIGLIAAAAALNSVVALLFFGSVIRYMLDFAPCFMLLAAFGLFTLEGRFQSALALGLLRGAALLLAAYTTAVGTLTVVNFYDDIPGSPPAAYRPIARVLSRPLFSLREHRWPGYGPAEIVFSLPTDRSSRREPIFAVTQDGRESALVFVDYVTERSIRFGYREHADDRTTRFSSSFPAEPGAVHTLRLSVGGPYAEFDGDKSLLRAQFDGLKLWDQPVVSIDVYPGAIGIGENSAASGAARRFTGEIRSHRTIAGTDISGALPLGARVRFILKPAMAGHAYPLVVSGHHGRGDMLFVRVRDDGKVGFCYDHWGQPERKSPEIQLRFGEPQVLECWIPQNAPPGTEPLVVARLNGVTVWHGAVPFFPSPPESITVGTNLIGGSTCETSFPDAVFEYLADPPPAN